MQIGSKSLTVDAAVVQDVIVCIPLICMNIGAPNMVVLLSAAIQLKQSRENHNMHKVNAVQIRVHTDKAYRSWCFRRKKNFSKMFSVRNLKTLSETRKPSIKRFC